jgi:hypothetical protein
VAYLSFSVVGSRLDSASKTLPAHDTAGSMLELMQIFAEQQSWWCE